MADIERAIREEIEYKMMKEMGEEPVSLAERVSVYGFSSLDEFFRVKADYQIESMEFPTEEVTPFTAANEMLMAIAIGAPKLLLMNTDATVVYHGNSEFNREYCEENNIPIIEYKTLGGTLVATEGELSMGVCIPSSVDIDQRWFLDKLAGILGKYCADVSVDNNDILIDGKKVCGATTYQSMTAFCAVAQFSFDDKTELINAICPPHGDKAPGFISAMTREQLREELETWL